MRTIKTYFKGAPFYKAFIRSYSPSAYGAVRDSVRLASLFLSSQLFVPGSPFSLCILALVQVNPSAHIPQLSSIPNSLSFSLKSNCVERRVPVPLAVL
jgi:hypothetical protein